MRYLLDTNAVSEPIRPRPSERLTGRLRDHDGEIALAAPVWYELRYGCSRLPPSRRRSDLEDYLERVVFQCFPILAYDHEAADWHARECARLEAQGRRPAFVDGQIAAIASVHGLTLVTSNGSDFAAFRDLQTESWM